MGKIVNLNKGDRYGRLSIIKEVEPLISKKLVKQRQFECQCDCGNIVMVRINNLHSGNTKSCGCGKVEYLKNRHKKENGKNSSKTGRSIW